jgi:hypothetical protein
MSLAAECGKGSIQPLSPALLDCALQYMAVLGSDWLLQYLKTGLSTLFQHMLVRKTDDSSLVVVRVTDLTVELTQSLSRHLCMWQSALRMAAPNVRNALRNTANPHWLHAVHFAALRFLEDLYHVIVIVMFDLDHEINTTELLKSITGYPALMLEFRNNNLDGYYWMRHLSRLCCAVKSIVYNE